MCFFNKHLSTVFVWLCLILAGGSFFTQSAQAIRPRDGYSKNIFDWGENWQPPRGEARLNWMGWYSSFRFNLQGVCYDVLEKDKKPYYLYLAVGVPVKGYILEPVVGWAWQDKEWVGGFRIYFDSSQFWRNYSNLEYQPKSQAFYYLTQLEFRLSPFLEMGVEVEGWGDIDDDLESNGAGVNIVFNLHALSGWKVPSAKASVELAVQYRELGGLWKPQAVARLIFTPKRQEHTPSTRRDNIYRR